MDFAATALFRERCGRALDAPLACLYGARIASLGDNNTGWSASPTSISRSYLRLYVAGYPERKGYVSAVENLHSGQQLPLYVEPPPAETSRLETFPLPAAWKGQLIRVLAEDAATRPAGWVAFAEVPEGKSAVEAGFAFRLLGLALLLFLTTILPAVSACLFVASKGVQNSLDLTAVALLAMGAVGYLAFWSYFLVTRSASSIAVLFWRPAVC